jgi:hypothetical protein
MAITVRVAGVDDLDAIAGLTSAARRRLAEWSPTWWRAAAGADELHPLWLGHLIGADGPIVRVSTEQGTVVGCAVSMPQAGQWFVDDVAMADEDRWARDGAAFLRAVPERPALTCVPIRDHAKTAAARAAGLAPVSTYWIGPTAPRDTDLDGDDRGLPPDVAIPPAAPHTFGGPFDPRADGALAFRTRAGIVVGSPSVTAPPVYDPNGTVTVVDRIAGGDRAALLAAAIGRTGDRGDTLIAVVCATEDRDLEELLQQAELTPILDVHRWPE